MKRIYMVSWVLLLMLNFFLIIRILGLNESHENNSVFSNREEVYFDLVLNQSMNLPLFTLELSDLFKIINEENERVSLVEILEGRPKIFLKISQNNCLTCIEAEFRVLKNFESSKSNITVIAEYNSLREAKILKERLGLEFPIVVINEPLPFTKLELHNVPYYFSINNALVVTSYLIPDRNHHGLSNKYLRKNLQVHQSVGELIDY